MASKNSSIMSVRIPNDTMEEYLELLEESGMTKRDFIKALLGLWRDNHTKWDDTKASRN